MNERYKNDYLLQMRKDAENARIPVISQRNAAFVCSVLAKRKPMRMLEIGSAIGLSSALFGQCLAQWNAQLSTIEISVPTQAIAQQHLQMLGLNNVHSCCGDAREMMRQWASVLTSKFDCIFIDAQKNQTHVFYELALTVLNPQGFIVIDDAWKFKHKMPKLYEYLAQKKQAYSLHFIDNEDATMLISPD